MNFRPHQIAVISLIVCASGCSTTKRDESDIPSLNPSVPPSYATKWLKFEFLGPRTAPYTVTWISTRRFKVGGLERLIVLRPEQFNIVASLTRKRMKTAYCGESIFHKAWTWRTLWIVEHDATVNINCVLLEEPAGEYIKEMKQLPEIHWSKSDMDALGYVCRVVNCEPSNDATAETETKTSN
jgi:hypothetical protein